MIKFLFILLLCTSSLAHAEPNAKDLLESGKKKEEIGDYTGAIQDLTKVIELNPKYVADAYHNRGLAKYKLKNYRAAIEDYTKAIELNPKDAEAYIHRGANKGLLGDYKEAIQDFTKAVELNPPNIVIAEAYYNIGFCKQALGNKEAAISNYNKAIKKDPKYWRAYLNRGKIKKDFGEFKEAIQDTTKAIGLNSQIWQPFHIRGLSKAHLGDYTEAIKDLTKAIELNPKNAEAFYIIGFCKHALGNTEGAIKDVVKATELNPKYAEAYYSIGAYKQELGDNEGAIPNYTKAIELAPAHAANAYNNRGLAKYNLKNYKEAIKDFNQAIELNSQHPNAYFNRGNTNRSRLHFDEAFRDLHKARSLFIEQGQTDKASKVSDIIFDMKRKGGNLSSPPLSTEKQHAFTFLDKTLSHYVFLLIALSVGIVMLYALILCLRMRIKRKWLWVIFIFCGIVKISINWTTGQITYNLVYVGLQPLLGFSAFRQGLYAPWMLITIIPLGAIIFLMRKKKLLTKGDPKQSDKSVAKFTIGNSRVLRICQFAVIIVTISLLVFLPSYYTSHIVCSAELLQSKDATKLQKEVDIVINNILSKKRLRPLIDSISSDLKRREVLDNLNLNVSSTQSSEEGLSVLINISFYHETPEVAFQVIDKIGTSLVSSSEQDRFTKSRHILDDLIQKLATKLKNIEKKLRENTEHTTKHSLLRDYALMKQKYEILHEEQQEMEAQSNLNIVKFAIVTPTKLSNEVKGPNRILIVIVGGILSLALWWIGRNKA